MTDQRREQAFHHHHNDNRLRDTSTSAGHDESRHERDQSILDERIVSSPALTQRSNSVPSVLGAQPPIGQPVVFPRNDTLKGLQDSQLSRPYWSSASHEHSAQGNKRLGGSAISTTITKSLAPPGPPPSKPLKQFSQITNSTQSQQPILNQNSYSNTNSSYQQQHSQTLPPLPPPPPPPAPPPPLPLPPSASSATRHVGTPVSVSYTTQNSFGAVSLSSQLNTQIPAMYSSFMTPKLTHAHTILDYNKISQVGEGTYGKVWKASRLADDSILALKQIKIDNDKEGFPVTAMREIKALQRVQHANIIRLFDIVTDPGKDPLEAYLVLEFMEHDLTGVLSYMNEFDGGASFDEDVTKCYMIQLLKALEFLHSNNIVHRDIKASNLLLNNRGELKLADFGLARILHKAGGMPEDRRVFTNRVITLGYRPPELLLGETVYGPEVDLWSVGCIMIEFFSGKTFFKSEDEIAQIQLIFSKCGSPTNENWPNAQSLPWYHLLLPKPSPRIIREELQPLSLSKGTLDLIDSLLTLDPAKRISARDALKSDYCVREYPPPKPIHEMPKFSDELHEMNRKRNKRKSSQIEDNQL